MQSYPTTPTDQIIKNQGFENVVGENYLPSLPSVLSYRKTQKRNRNKLANPDSVGLKVNKKTGKAKPSCKLAEIRLMISGRHLESNTNNSIHVEPDACTPTPPDVKGKLISITRQTALLTFMM